LNQLLQARESAEMSDHVSLAQGPVRPWTTDEEAEQYAKDPRAYLMKRTDKLIKSVKMGANNILVATFYLPEFTMLRGANGEAVPFFVSDKTTDEAQWQGRVGLLIAKGPLAWKNSEDGRIDFGGTNYKLGEWVCYDRQDGRQIAINRVHCRRLRDVDVWGSTDNPMSVY
jgi:hypothetical protein